MGAILKDKGYKGFTDLISSVNPKTKLINGFMTTEKEAENGRISRDRVLVEHCFRHLTQLFAKSHNKCRWK